MNGVIVATLLMLAGAPDDPTGTALPAAPATAMNATEPTATTEPSQPPAPADIAPQPDPPAIAQESAVTGPAEGTPIEAAPPQSASAEAEGDATQEMVVVGRRSSPIDPLQSVNAASFEVAQSLDKALIGPISTAYRKGLPGPVRRGFANFISNLHEPIVFLNDLLQLRPRRALKTFSRFAINSTVGVAGVMDIAKKRPFKMHGHWNSFADTMGVWGIKTGPFFFVPLLGPTTARDFAGNFIDRLVLPFSVGAPFNKTSYTMTTNVGHALDYRAEREEEVQAIRASVDPYVASREQYLTRRASEIAVLRGPGDLGQPPKELSATQLSATGEAPSEAPTKSHTGETTASR